VNTIALPPYFWAIASHWHRRKNPYRNRVEVGGFLVANPATPNRVAFATGPGRDAEHEYASVGLCRYDVEPAVEAAGYRVIGDWHTHPVNLRPSDTDHQTWLGNLRNSTLDRWVSIILTRDEKGWSDMGAWSTYWRDGAYRVAPAEVTPGLAAARGAGDMSWIVKQTSLLDQASWIQDPDRLHQDLAVLDLNADLVHRMKMQETNERLKRLGMREMKLGPLPRREPVVPGEAIYGGALIRRQGIGRVLSVGGVPL
jgi:hypothetical protein